MGFGLSTDKTAAHEFIFHVHGRKFHLYIPHNDGWNVADAPHSVDLGH